MKILNKRISQLVSDRGDFKTALVKQGLVITLPFYIVWIIFTLLSESPSLKYSLRL